MSDGGSGLVSSMFDWLFRNRSTGAITIAQWPNIALWIFLATLAAQRVLPLNTGIGTAIGSVSVGALGWWAIDEVVRGVNPWRRMLGACGAAFALSGLLALVR